MDSTVALFVGLGVFAIVVIAIVAASRGGSRSVYFLRVKDSTGLGVFEIRRIQCSSGPRPEPCYF
jgi:hypothetical protein